MIDRKTVMSWLEGLAQDDWAEWHSNSEVQTTAQAALDLLKEQEVKPIIHCKDCKYGLYTGTEYLCDKHSGHENRLGEDQYYKEWHNGSWYCADGERVKNK